MSAIDGTAPESTGAGAQPSIPTRWTFEAPFYEIEEYRPGMLQVWDRQGRAWLVPMAECRLCTSHIAVLTRPPGSTGWDACRAGWTSTRVPADALARRVHRSRDLPDQVGVEYLLPHAPLHLVPA